MTRLAVAIVILLCGSAAAQRQDSAYPITSQVRHAGTVDVSSGRWTRNGGQQELGTKVVFANTCTWTGGALYGGIEACEHVYDEGRVPSTGDPNAPSGAADDNQILSFEFAYCTFWANAFPAKIGFWNNLNGQCVGGVAPTPPPASTTATAYFDLSGLGLPGSTTNGFQACWIVTVDTSSAGFTLLSDGDGIFDNNQAVDLFTWSFDHSNPTSPAGKDGIVISGDPSAAAPGSCTYGISCGTDPFGGGPCGTGLGAVDNYWVNVDGVAVGDTTSGLCPNGVAPFGGTNCYFFGGYPTNPFSSFWMKLTASGRTTPEPCVPLGNTPPIEDPLILANLVPESWQAQDVSWSGDVSPHNKIDDRIDASSNLLFDILVNHSRVVLGADVTLLEDLSTTSSVQMQCSRIPTVAMMNVDKTEIAQIASLDSVAFIELQDMYMPSLDVSLEAMKVRSGFYSPNTVQDQLPGITGAGVNIVIMDTGVDNDLHASLTQAPFIGGYDAFTHSFTDPDDTHGHGTHVASIALGRQTANTPRGVAPGAGLIDVKAIPGTSLHILDALERIYDNRLAWNVSVINMSFSTTVSQDGKDAISQLVDVAESMNIVAVAAAANNGPNNSGLPSPAAATRAITVGAAGDQGTPNRADDTLAIFSNRGPRQDDGDLDCLDELKPEVTSYGVSIRAALHNSVDQTQVLSGTSMAAPHVAGLAALMRQHYAGINAASVRALIIASAEPRGSASSTCDPIWNDGWGWGLVDAFAALCTVLPTDLTFQNHPADPSWLSADITTSPFPAKVGQLTTVTAALRNNSPTTAMGVRVKFGVHLYAAAIPTFYDIGTVIADIPPGGPHLVSIQWVPKHPGHQCMKVEIAYGCDSDLSNNTAQRNLNVASSPIQFEVRNTLTQAPAAIDLNVACTGNFTGWDVILSHKTVTLGGDDPPVVVTALPVPPISAPAGETILVHISATMGSQLLGGVSFFTTKVDCNGNGIDDYFDILNGTSSDANGDGIPDECGSATTYCTAKTSSNGCVPQIGFTGSSSIAAGNFAVTGTMIEGAQLGVVFWGTNGPAATPFQGGFLCVQPPVLRLPIQNSGGILGTCTGSYSQPAAAGVLATVGAGNTVWFQIWFRDPGSASGTGLSDGLEVPVFP